MTVRVYLAGPMRNLPLFNFPAFKRAAERLRAEGYEVFNPAESDTDRLGVDISKGNLTGSEELAKKEHGFDIRKAFYADTRYICLFADLVMVLPNWEFSSGARAEVALAEALGIGIVYLGEDYV